MKYSLNFKSDDYGKKMINEPVGMESVTLNLNQKTDGGGMGRDISFSSGEALFEFTDQRDHQLKQLLYYHRRFGFESKVILSIEIGDSVWYCDLDFSSAETDGLTYFNAKGIEDSSLQIIKARKSTKVNLFSDEDIDGNFIEPLVGVNMLLLAKPVAETSQWKSDIKITHPKTFYSIQNFWQQQTKYEISKSYTPYEVAVDTVANQINYPMVEFSDNARNVVMKIKCSMICEKGNGGFSFITLKLLYGSKPTGVLDFIKRTVNLAKTQNSGSDTLEVDVLLNLGNMNRGDVIYLDAFTDAGGSNSIYNTLTVNYYDVSISTDSIAYNSIAQSIRLVDVMRQVIKSISGLQINTPRFDYLGEFYDNRLLSGNLLRGIISNGFSVSLEDIENSLDEMKGDYEIGSDGNIFFGIEKDFYANNESGFFSDIQFSSMNKTFNPKYTVNEFKYGYKNYQSLKETQELNSADTIHGESIQTFYNKNVENTKEASIEWTRDAFLIETTRALALEYNASTASQDDDTIFAIDSVETTFNNSFTEVTELQHTYDSVNNRLSIRNDGSVNFASLGIVVDSIFTILPTDLNAGTYRVFSVDNSALELTRLLNTNTSAGNGLRSTKYTYEITIGVTPFTNYTDQGFSETTNLNASASYSNRRYSLARNKNKYWQSYLATCNLYWKDKPLKTTYYKNNGDYTAKYDGLKLTENEDIIPLKPILSPILYNDIVFANVDFEDFVTLSGKIRSERGYIRSIDHVNQVIKVYPVDMEYSIFKKELKIKGEEKYEPINMSISTANDYILVNNETRLDTLRWEIVNEMVYLYDTNRYRLYNGVYWFEVAVNGAIANNVEELKEWLSLIK